MEVAIASPGSVERVMTVVAERNQVVLIVWALMTAEEEVMDFEIC